MRFARVAAAATALSLVGAATVVAAPAHAATPGVGTSLASSSLLDINVGSLLNLKVLADEARSTIDPSVATRSAFSKLNVLQLTSALPAPLNNISLPAVESKTPGGSGSVAGPSLNLASLPALSSLPVVGSLLGGILSPASLTSAVDADGAHSALTSGLGNLNVVGGLISATGLSSILGTNAKGAIADGSRTIKAGSIDVLNLGALLNGLGLPLTNLPLGVVSDLLGKLGVPVAGLPSATNLEDFVTELQTTLTGLTTELTTTLGTTIDHASAPVTQGILSGLGLPIPTVGQLLTTVQGVINQVVTLITGVLKTALHVLDGVSLLKVDGIEMGTTTKAADTVSGSVADIVAKIGDVKIGGLSLPGLDLNATLTQVTSLVTSIQSTLSGVLGSISPDLANLIKVSIFDKDANTGVTQAGGYIKSLAGVSALTAKIVPPLNLGGILGGLTSAGGVGSILTGLTGGSANLPVLGNLMPSLNGLLGGVTSVLTQGATIKLASVTSGASFTTPVAATNNTLPRTGGNEQMALIGMALVIAAIASRRFVLAHRVQ